MHKIYSFTIEPLASIRKKELNEQFLENKAKVLHIKSHHNYARVVPYQLGFKIKTKIR